MSTRHALRPAILVGALLLSSASQLGVAEALISTSASVTDAIEWHHLGSFRGGWASMLAGVSSRLDTFYLGTADGRVWKADDAGHPWHSPFNTQPASSIDTLVPQLAPFNPNVIHVGSEQVAARYNVGADTSVHRSTDGGKSQEAFKSALSGGDDHFVGIDPHDTPRMISIKGGQSWSSRHHQPRAVSPARATGLSLAGADSVAQFLDGYWQRPLAPQGAAPPQFTPLEAALDPASCGTCHVQQFRDWSGTRHAKSMGPGVLGQLMNTDAHARDEQQNCLRCHAPLAEQADSLATALSTRNAATGAGLYGQGVICAACHVRGNRRFGPPRRDGSAPKPRDALPHEAWQASTAFAGSRFCASCHQFKANGYALNGKLLENTYAEWKASPYANEGRPCQSCHMPDRRHLWRGIHEAEMVRSGVSIGIVPPRVERGIVHAALTVRNTGTGHDFPTYVTPRVVVEIMQEDAAGHAIDGTRREYVIARQVPLDLSHEIADTRLAPGAQATLNYALPWLRPATKLRYHITVEPDAYYTRFYRAQIATGAGTGEALIRRALAESLASRYTLFDERRAIDMAEK